MTERQRHMDNDHHRHAEDDDVTSQSLVALQAKRIYQLEQRLMKQQQQEQQQKQLTSSTSSSSSSMKQTTSCSLKEEERSSSRKDTNHDAAAGDRSINTSSYYESPRRATGRRRCSLRMGGGGEENGSLFSPRGSGGANGGPLFSPRGANGRRVRRSSILAGTGIGPPPGAQQGTTNPPPQPPTTLTHDANAAAWIEELETELKQLEEENDELVEDVNVLLEENDHFQSQLDEKDKQIDHLSKKLEGVEKERDTLAEDYETLQHKTSHNSRPNEVIELMNDMKDQLRRKERSLKKKQIKWEQTIEQCLKEKSDLQEELYNMNQQKVNYKRQYDTVIKQQDKELLPLIQGLLDTQRSTTEAAKFLCRTAEHSHIKAALPASNLVLEKLNEQTQAIRQLLFQMEQMKDSNALLEIAAASEDETNDRGSITSNTILRGSLTVKDFFSRRNIMSAATSTGGAAATTTATSTTPSPPSPDRQYRSQSQSQKQQRRLTGDSGMSSIESLPSITSGRHPYIERTSSRNLTKGVSGRCLKREDSDEPFTIKCVPSAPSAAAAAAAEVANDNNNEDDNDDEDADDDISIVSGSVASVTSFMRRKASKAGQWFLHDDGDDPQQQQQQASHYGEKQRNAEWDNKDNEPSRSPRHKKSLSDVHAINHHHAVNRNQTNKKKDDLDTSLHSMLNNSFHGLARSSFRLADLLASAADANDETTDKNKKANEDSCSLGEDDQSMAGSTLQQLEDELLMESQSLPDLRKEENEEKRERKHEQSQTVNRANKNKPTGTSTTSSRVASRKEEEEDEDPFATARYNDNKHHCHNHASNKRQPSSSADKGATAKESSPSQTQRGHGHDHQSSSTAAPKRTSKKNSATLYSSKEEQMFVQFVYQQRQRHPAAAAASNRNLHHQQSQQAKKKPSIYSRLIGHHQPKKNDSEAFLLSNRTFH